MAFKSSILFDVLSNVLTKKSEELYQHHISNVELWKTYTSFMTLRYLTMCNSEEVRNVVLNNYLALEKMPAKAQYHWLLKNVPRLKSSWIQYIK